MKAKCILAEGEEYTFICTTSDHPEVGKDYTLEDATNGTTAQNKAIHALIGEYFKSGVHPVMGGESYDKLRNHLKDKLGAGKEKYFFGYFAGDKMVKGEAKTWQEIPEECRTLYHQEQAFIVGKLKSISKYTKKERAEFIDNLITDMTATGVNSKKFNEILKGMEDGKENT